MSSGFFSRSRRFELKILGKRARHETAGLYRQDGRKKGSGEGCAQPGFLMTMVRDEHTR